ncbi:hypothetical protein JS562_53090, partial [Agrobacterium sp. S2]|nr:hypothetical protein [Agrobacterium sp. S2]
EARLLGINDPERKFRVLNASHLARWLEGSPGARGFATLAPAGQRRQDLRRLEPIKSPRIAMGFLGLARRDDRADP